MARGISSTKNLSGKVEVFQNALIAHSTGGSCDADEYRTLREEISNHPLLKDIAPRFLRTCRTPAGFWQFIKYKFPGYAERRQYLWDEFRPMLERIDSPKATPADRSVSLALENFDTASVHQIWLKAMERRETEPEGAIRPGGTIPGILYAKGPTLVFKGSRSGVRAGDILLSMQFGGTVLYVDEVSAVVDFYRRAFGLELRFLDEALGFAELETGGSTLAIAAHSLGKMLMPDGYTRPVDGQPAGVEIAFLTADVSASFAKAIAEGAVPITAPRRMPWGLEVAYVRAPEGTIIGFSEPPPTALGRLGGKY